MVVISKTLEQTKKLFLVICDLEVEKSAHYNAMLLEPSPSLLTH